MSRRHQSRTLTASDGRNDLILLDLRIKRCAVKHVFAIHLLGDHAAMLAGLTQNALGFANGLARLHSFGRLPLHDLMTAPVRHENASHGILQSRSGFAAAHRTAVNIAWER